MEERTGKAIGSAIRNLEASLKALVEKDETTLMKHVWQAAADSEYALFLFSLTHEKESEGSPRKSKASLKKMEIEPTLTLAQDLLVEAKEKVDAEDFDEAYKKTWMARGYLLKAQGTLEKKR